MTAANVLSYFAQVGLLVLVCSALPRLVGLHSPSLQHVFWRTLLAACLLLPLIQPWHPAEAVAATAGASPVEMVASGPTALPTAPSSAGESFDWTRAIAIVLAAGAIVRLGWIALGLLRLRGLRRRAVEPALGFDDLQQTIGVSTPIHWSPDATHPVTFGVFRPIVLLPYAIKPVDAAAQRAVVAHELHHVRRHDWLWTIAEEILRSVFWFHPAMWWLISRVQLARETVVDELSILTTNARRAYLDALLTFADDSGLRQSPAFSARRHLFHRVMLLSKEGGMSSLRIATASCVLAVAVGFGSWGAVVAFPLYGAPVYAAGPQVPPPPPPRDPLSVEAHHRIAQQSWEKANKDLTLSPEQKLDLILRGIASEDRALNMNPDYVPALTYKNIFLRMQANLTANVAERTRLLTQADELREKVIALRTPAGMPPPPPPPPPAGGGSAGMTFVSAPPMPGEFEERVKALTPVRVGDDIKVPVKVRDVRPVYPPIAREAHVQGVVIIEALLDGEGAVVDARILRSIPLLDQAALDAVRQWRFMPVIVNGTPQPVLLTVTVNFTAQ